MAIHSLQRSVFTAHSLIFVVSCYINAACTVAAAVSQLSAVPSFPTAEGTNPLIYIYPIEGNDAVLATARGWLRNEYNMHNQYALEYAVHANALSSGRVTADPQRASLFLVPLYLRLALYNTDALRRLQDAAESTLRKSPWLRRHGGQDHIVVWTSQREPERLLGGKLAAFLRRETRVRFLAVEANDPRPAHLVLIAERDVLIPPYVPQVQVVAQPTPVRERHYLAVFGGSVVNAPGVRGAIADALRSAPDALLLGTAELKMRQEPNSSSPHALDVTAVVQRTLAGMDRARFCLCPRGITPGTRRVFEALARGCIPVVVSDNWVLPFASNLPRLAKGELVHLLGAT